MTQQQENLSALVDGEINDPHLIDRLGKDDELAQTWQRYHVMRHAMRKEMPEQADFDISNAIADALKDEPAIVAPKRSWQDLPVVATVLPLVRQGGQLAIAASVAVAMVLGVQQYNQTDAEQPFSSAPTVLPTDPLGGLSPVSLEQSRPVARTDVLEQRRRINAYLADHRQQLRLKNVAQKNEQNTDKADDGADPQASQDTQK